MRKNRVFVTALLAVLSLILAACVSQPQSPSPVRSLRRVAGTVGNEMHDNVLHFKIQGLSSVSLSQGDQVSVDKLGQQGVDCAPARANCICPPGLQTCSDCFGPGWDNGPSIGVATGFQAPPGEWGYGTSGPGYACLGTYNVTGTLPKDKPPALHVNAGRDPQPPAAQAWENFVLSYHESDRNSATFAVNTHIETVIKDNKANDAFANGFPTEMNFWVVGNMTFLTDWGVQMVCPNVMLGQQSTDSISQQYVQKIYKLTGNDAQDQSSELKEQLYASDPPTAATYIVGDIVIAGTTALAYKIGESDTWWAAQVNSNIDTELQGFIAPPDPESGYFHQLALSCQDSGGTGWLVLLYPSPKSDGGPKNDQFSGRFVKAADWFAGIRKN